MKIYTVPFGHNFLKNLADFLWHESLNAPHILAKQIILLPNQRSCRALETALLRKSSSILMPKMIALPTLPTSIFGKMVVPQEKVINKITRMGLISCLIAKFKNLSASQNYNLSKALLELLDDLYINDCANSNFLEAEFFTQHQQESVLFLKLVVENWGDILSEAGGTDPHSYYRDFISQLSDFLITTNLAHPITVAGTTGSIPATAELIAAVLKLPRGRLILPGFDKSTSTDVPPQHPQWTMQRLLKRLSVHPQDIELLPNLPVMQDTFLNNSNSNKRTIILRNLMASDIIHPVSDNHGNVKFCHKNNDNILPWMMTAKNIYEEAKVIAAIMCHYYNFKKTSKTVALITSNQQLGCLVKNYLHQLQIPANLSLGIPLSDTLLGQFLILVSRNLSSNLGDYLNTMKHPLAFAHLPDEKNHLQQLYLYEKWLRTYDKKFIHPPEEPEVLRFWQKLQKIFLPLNSQKINNNRIPFAELLKKHLELLENINPDYLNAPYGEEFKIFLQDLLASADLQPAITVQEYTVLFAQLLKLAEPVNEIQLNQQILIVGALEARLQTVDIAILGDMNEGSWPATITSGPWFSPMMREQIKLPPLEKRIGLAAHDFCASFGAEVVYLTRSQQELPSRFWLRLETFAKMHNVNLTPPEPWLNWAKLQMDSIAANNINVLQAPCPTPPLNVRPQVLAASHVEQLMRDPYTFYARSILKLYQLNSLEKTIDYKEKGIIFHKFLENFFKNPENDFMHILDDILHNYSIPQWHLNLWRPQLFNIYQWLKNFHHTCNSGFLIEQMGMANLDGFQLYAIADRIDLSTELVKIIDYKTTTPPSISDIRKGFSPQLIIESIIAQQGGFTNKNFNTTAEIWHVTGKTDPVTIYPLDFDMDLAKDGLQKLLNYYLRQLTPFLACPIPEKKTRHMAYEHLARINEWI